MKSRLYWPGRAYLGCGSHGCAEGPGGPRSAHGDTVTLVRQLVGPWQYQCSGILEPGWVSTRYTTPPGTTLPTQPRVLPLPTHPRDHRTGVPECTDRRCEVDQGDPRGRLAHHTYRARSSHRTPALRPLFPVSLLEPGAGCGLWLGLSTCGTMRLQPSASLYINLYINRSWI